MAYPFVLKAQVMTGGRGKAGGVKVCRNEADYRKYAHDILNMEIKGHKVHGLLAEQMMKADRELYLSITLQGVCKADPDRQPDGRHGHRGGIPGDSG